MPNKPLLKSHRQCCMMSLNTYYSLPQVSHSDILKISASAHKEQITLAIPICYLNNRNLKVSKATGKSAKCTIKMSYLTYKLTVNSSAKKNKTNTRFFCFNIESITINLAFLSKC